MVIAKEAPQFIGMLRIAGEILRRIGRLSGLESLQVVRQNVVKRGLIFDGPVARVFLICGHA
jgi:hypothetical protein